MRDQDVVDLFAGESGPEHKVGLADEDIVGKKTCVMTQQGTQHEVLLRIEGNAIEGCA